MKKTSIEKWMKRTLAGVMSSALVVTGIILFPTVAKAEEPATDIQYVERTSEFKTWKEQDAKVAPVMEGYLFGGWYKDEGGNEYLTEDTAASYTGTAYAKFVPAYVLSVKAQLSSGAVKNDRNPANLRILTGLDSLNYQYVGVQVSLGNTPELQNSTKTNVYDKVQIGTGENASTVEATETFGPDAHFYGVWKVGNITDEKDASTIYVRPYWETMDGTTVYGLAKYIHAEDGYEKYISVPINMMSGAEAAAGIATMEFDSEKLEFVDMEQGRMFDDAMEYNVSGNTVKIVGNGATVDQYKQHEPLFASIRFRAKTGTSLYETSNEYRRIYFPEFLIKDPGFYNWSEQEIENPGVWDIKY